jgi:uncharacterized protein (TIGR02646 family)
MIKLAGDIRPDKDLLDKLHELQKQVDTTEDFQEQIKKAKKLFAERNRKGNKVFDEIKLKLTEMCSGARRCIYCEDSMSDEIEHILPKSLYPNKCFSWDNYLYICGICNTQKNNKFAVFQKDNVTISIINSQKDKNSLTSPPEGKPVLINPRVEDAMEFCMLDLSGTFKFIIIVPPNTPSYKRANYTFNEILKLNNQREALRQARANAYGNYKARFYEYAHQKQKDARPEKLAKMIHGIKTESHPTVWKEMQRYHKLNILSKIDQELDELFINSPEALNW